MRIPVQIRIMAPMEAATATIAVIVSLVIALEVLAALDVVVRVLLLADDVGAVTTWVTSIVEGVGCSVTMAAG